jgi:DJ-1 family protein
MTKALVLMANGVEEMEAVICADVLRRAGVETLLLGLDGEGSVTGSRGIILGVDQAFRGDETADLVVLPGGGEGAKRLAEDAKVLALLKRFEKDEAWIAAICAAPIALVAAGVGKGKTMTSHPSVRETVEPFAGSYVEEAVAIDSHLVTGRGPGAAFDFALDLVGLCVGPQKAGEVRSPMMFS